MVTKRHSAYISASADTSATSSGVIDGRDYLIVPVTILIANTVVRPMGSTVAGLVSPDLVEFYPSSWDGRPLIPNHPVAADGVTPVSANSPAILDAEGFGQLFNTSVVNGKLRSEAWIDKARAEALGGYAKDVLDRVVSGQQVEVSIGAVVIADQTPGIINGVEYGEVWLLALPDHLAMLPNGREGACSLEMGCGGPRAAQQHLSTSGGRLVAMSVMSKARKPTYSGTESTAWSSPTFADYVKGLYTGTTPPKTLADADADLKSDIAAHTLLGNPDSTSFRELSFFPVVDPRNGKLNEKALKAVLGGRGAKANILSAVKKSAQDMARKLLKSEFDIDMSEPAAPKTMASGLSDSDVRSLISDALYLVESSAYYLYIDSYYEDDHTVIYCVSSDYDAWDDFFQRTYEIDATATTPIAHVGNTRTKMDRKIVYEAAPVEAQVSITGASSGADPVDDPKSLLGRLLGSLGFNATSGNAISGAQTSTQPLTVAASTSCKCGGTEEMATPTVNPKAVAIQSLISGTSPFKAEHQAQLEAMPDDVISDLAAKYAAEVPVVTPAPAQTQVAPAAVATPEPSAVAPVAVTMQQWLETNNAPAELHSLVSAHVAAEARERDYLTKAVIKACGTRVGAYTEPQLKVKDMDDLRALAASMAIGSGPASADYSGRGIPINAAAYAEDKSAAANPPRTYDIALAKRRGETSASASTTVKATG